MVWNPPPVFEVFGTSSLPLVEVSGCSRIHDDIHLLRQLLRHVVSNAKPINGHGTTDCCELSFHEPLETTFMSCPQQVEQWRRDDLQIQKLVKHHLTIRLTSRVKVTTVLDYSLIHEFFCNEKGWIDAIAAQKWTILKVLPGHRFAVQRNRWLRNCSCGSARWYEQWILGKLFAHLHCAAD